MSKTYRDTFTLAPAQLTNAELEVEVERIDFLWEMHLKQLLQGNPNRFRDEEMTRNKKRKAAILREVEMRSLG